MSCCLNYDLTNIDLQNTYTTTQSYAYTTQSNAAALAAMASSIFVLTEAATHGDVMVIEIDTI